MRKVIGVDISKAKLNYCLVTDEGEVLDEGHIQNTLDGFEVLQTILQQENLEVIFEATGVYSRRFQYYLELHDIGYTRMNPLQAKKEMDSLRVTKNDAIDARQLATLQMTKHYPTTIVEGDVYLELRHQHRFYQEITDDGAQAKNRLHKCLQDTFSEIEQLFSGHSTSLYRIIQIIPHAYMIKGKSVAHVAEMMRPIYGTSQVRALKIARKLLTLANRTAVSVPVTSTLTEQTRHWATKIIAYQEQKLAIIDAMSKAAEVIAEVDILESIPGLGRVNALCLIAELGNINRFATPQKMNAFIGIDLRFNDSGQMKTTGFTTKRGNATARKILFKTVLCIVSAAKRGKSCNVSEWYRKRSRDIVGSRKKIIVGAMDRVLRLIHHMVIHQETFNYK
ncbi:IS110 family transposase [Leuconostoc gelidum subsp. gelidum]|uniref:IS110 family transposase n=1 Tax=Leuconostoc gelidum TaxID=1244 RepID=UPI001CC667C9|nr:IS110 family transposase [Leuconostoc gelidum]MBZ5977872.1 IS110 family transposase [Leuconostoc gelidum subsp. gelidum]MBZ6001242.1 IS110 family transposase [Leuconostoc gelidum subsp. gelidum]